MFAIGAIRFARFIAVFAFVIFARVAFSDELKITSSPPGATVAIDGIVVGKTPFSKEYPGGYFHRTKTSIGARLEHPLAARVTLEGYATKEIQLTNGPMEWHSLNGRYKAQYWLFKTNVFEVQLDSIAQTFTGIVSETPSSESTEAVNPLERLIAHAKPAVVYLKGLDKSGTGFLVTETGVIATNAHLAREEESLMATFSDMQQLEANVVYVDAELDIALLKVSGAKFSYLTLAPASQVRQGQGIFAIGNPGEGMLFSATPGIVSAVGPYPTAGPGTWIQTNAEINPGNSGGPLLNEQGDVIGINTQKLTRKNSAGIAFALSASDLLQVLRRFYPETTQQTKSGTAVSRFEQESASSTTTSATGFGTATFPEPVGAEIYLDGMFVGNVPSTIQIAEGTHRIRIHRDGAADWLKSLTILRDSKITLAPPTPLPAPNN